MTINRTPLLALTAGAITLAVAACSSASPVPSAAVTTRPAASVPATSAATPSAPATSAPATSPASGPASAVSLPNTPVGAQARWLFAAAVHPPIPAAAINAHFDQAFLAKAPAAELNQVLGGVKTLTLDAVTLSTADGLVMTVTENGSTQLKVSMSADSAGLISGLLLQPATTTSAGPPAPASWAAVDSQVKSAAPQVRMLVAQVSGNTCRPIQAIGASTPAPLGSAFKLYVLDALARAVASGKVSWDQPLTVTSQLKSLPSGQLQNEPDGTKVTVRQAADAMISVSDNTAANLLMALLGRPAVATAAATSGLADPGLDRPFLSTRELFVLKLIDWPRLADSYLAGSAAARAALLAGTIDHEPYSALTAADSAAWTQPRDINSLEWFASPTDICHVYASLAQLAGSQPGLAPVASALQINDGGLGLDSAQWRTVWFKGGSEPGVVTLNYLATTRGGQAYVVSVLAANPGAAIPASATLTLLSAVKGAFGLAARS
jgi:Beta-lactamase enzyme family/ORF 12 gene product N-terminal